MTALKALIGVLLITCTSGCRLIFGAEECGPTRRDTYARSAILNAVGATVGVAEIRFVELRGAPAERDVSFIVGGPAYGDSGPLRGHVRSLELVDTRRGAVFDLQFFEPLSDDWTIVAVRSLPALLVAEEFEALRSSALAGALRLELRTDLESLQQLSIPLRQASSSGWGRAKCS
jgi:hypothetical protein